MDAGVDAVTSSRARRLADHPGVFVQTSVERFRWKFDALTHPPPANRPILGSAPAFLSELMGVSAVEAQQMLGEVQSSRLVGEIRANLDRPEARRFPEALAPAGGWLSVLETIHASVRRIRPQCVIETGIGLVGGSSTFILDALERNGTGELWSVDRDRYHELFGVHVGQGIPDRLRARHHVLARESRTALPELLERLTPELFLHDGLHTYANMRFEFGAAWPRIPPGGLLLSDDLTNSSLEDAVRPLGLRPSFVAYGDRNFFGGLRKPPAE